MNQEKNSHSIGLGIFLILIASAAIYFATSIKQLGSSNNADPGAKLFPIGLSIFLIAGAVHEIALAIGNNAERESDISWDGLINLLLMCVSISAYVYLLDIIGFASASILFSGAWMTRMGSHWASSLIITVILIVAIEALFREIFKVQLPEGSGFLSIDAFIVNR